jgi:flagellar protein FliS
MKATRAYARATQETASKERLMVLLFEAALRNMRHGATLLETNRVPEALPLLTKASDIVAELAATLDSTKAPQLTPLLADVYLFVAKKLAEAGWSKHASSVREAERVFAPVVDGFREAVAAVAAQATP